LKQKEKQLNTLIEVWSQEETAWEQLYKQQEQRQEALNHIYETKNQHSGKVQSKSNEEDVTVVKLKQYVVELGIFIYYHFYTMCNLTCLLK
jgi:hypothetical protein